MGLGSGISVSCGVGHKCGLDPSLLWLWCTLAAVALIRPLAGEPPYATGEAIKKKKGGGQGRKRPELYKGFQRTVFKDRIGARFPGV